MSDPGQPVAVPASPGAPPLDVSVAVRDPLALVGWAAALLVAVGSFGTWAKVSQFSAGGMDGDGVLTLVLAVVAAAAIFVAALGRSAPRFGSDWVAAVAAGCAMAIAVYDAIDISKNSTGLLDRVIERTVGWGLWLTLAGSIVLVAVGVVLVMRARWLPRR